MDFQETIDWLYSQLPCYQKKGVSAYKQDMINVQTFFQQNGFDHLSFKSIHIAGTNGKGSTAAIISSILSSANISTGLFTSPHLFSFTERIRLGLEPIKESDFTQVFEIIWQHAKEVPQRLNIPKKHQKQSVKT